MEKPEIEKTALELLLEDCAGGGKRDSEGQFTVNYAAARKKLAEFQLPNPSFYLLKLLQSAFWGGASRVQIELSQRGAVLLASDWHPSAELIAGSLCQTDGSAGSDPQTALISAVRSVLAQNATVAIRFPQLDKDNVLVLSDNLEWRTHSGEESRFQVAIQWPKGAARTAIEDERVLRERCYCYPLPLTVNGESFDQLEPFWDGQTHLRSHLPGSTVLARGSCTSDGTVKHILVRASLEVEAHISVIRGGVISDVIRKNLDVPGLDVLVDGENLTTDLTGLQIRRDDRFSELISELPLEPGALKEKAMNTVMALKFESAPADIGHLSTGKGCLLLLIALFGVGYLSVYLFANFNPLAALGGLATFCLLIFLVLVKADRVGINLFHTPKHVEYAVREAMLARLAGKH